MVQPGRYRHYKGHEYEVLGVARHSETEEEYVVYHALYGDRVLWIRLTAMFMETVIVDGLPCPRLQLLPTPYGALESLDLSRSCSPLVPDGRSG